MARVSRPTLLGVLGSPAGGRTPNLHPTRRPHYTVVQVFVTSTLPVCGGSACSYRREQTLRPPFAPRALAHLHHDELSLARRKRRPGLQVGEGGPNTVAPDLRSGAWRVQGGGPQDVATWPPLQLGSSGHRPPLREGDPEDPGQFHSPRRFSEGLLARTVTHPRSLVAICTSVIFQSTPGKRKSWKLGQPGLVSTPSPQTGLSLEGGVPGLRACHHF